jgi:hypothetical protein
LAWDLAFVDKLPEIALFRKESFREANGTAQVLCRALVLGVKTDRIAKKLHFSAETVRDLMATGVSNALRRI